MSSATISLNIIAANLGGGVFGSVFSSLATLAVLSASAGGALGGAGTALSVIAPIAIGAGLAFATFSGGLEKAITDAAQLEWQLARLENALGTAGAAPELRQNIESVAGASIFTSTQVAEADAVLANFGYSSSQIMGGMSEAAVQLAEATGSDLPTATQLLAQTERDFADQGLSTTQIIDMLTRAYHNGLPDISTMQSILGTAGGNANSLNVSLRDLLTTADILGPAMGNSQRAGAALNYMLTNLTDPTSKANAELTKLGIITADGANKLFDANGVFLGFKNTIDQLNAATAGFNPEQKSFALDQIFNVRSGQGARILTTLQQFDDKYNKIYDDLGKTGAAADAANRLTGTALGRWAELQTNITGLFSNIGSGLLQSGEPLIEWLAGVVSVLGNNQPLDDFLGKLLLVGTAVTGLTLAGLALFLAISTFGPAVAIVAGAFAASAVVAAEVAAAWTWLQQNGKTLKPVLDDLGTGLGHVKDAVGGFVTIVGNAWTTAQPFLQSLKNIAGMATDQLSPAFQQLMDALGRVKDAIPQDEWDKFFGLLKIVGTFLGGTFVVVLLSVALGAIGFAAAVITFFAGLVSTLLSAATVIIDTIRTVSTVIDDLRSGHMDKAKADWAAGWAQMTTDSQNFGTQLVNTVDNTVSSLKTTGDMAKSIGVSIGDGLYNGFITSMNSHYDGYARSSSQVAYTIGRSLQFQSPPKEGPLSDSDKWGGRLIDLLTTGMEGKLPSLQATTARVAGAMVVTPATAAAASQQAALAVGGGSGSGRGGNIEVPVYLDGREIARTTFDVIKGQLKGMGLSRMYK